KTSWEAARILGITERTVNFHLNSAIRKTGCKNRYQAIARNVAAGQLRPDMQRLNITRILKT
ncbi:MAG: LuxR C-terminal-related transcriptional regulator, partial [Aeromonadaceae bacterium]